MLVNCLAEFIFLRLTFELNILEILEACLLPRLPFGGALMTFMKLSCLSVSCAVLAGVQTLIQIVFTMVEARAAWFSVPGSAKSLSGRCVRLVCICVLMIQRATYTFKWCYPIALF